MQTEHSSTYPSAILKKRSEILGADGYSFYDVAFESSEIIFIYKAQTQHFQRFQVAAVQVKQGIS